MVLFNHFLTDHFWTYLDLFRLFWTFSDYFGRNLQTNQALNQKTNLKHKEKPPHKNPSITEFELQINSQPALTLKQN